MRYQYNYVMNNGQMGLLNRLDLLGKEGWKLVQVSGNYKEGFIAWLMREVKE